MGRVFPSFACASGIDFFLELGLIQVVVALLSSYVGAILILTFYYD